MYTSSAEETLLLNEVGSRLRHAIPVSVPKVGADNDPELLQDGLVMALGMLRAAGNSGKKPSAGNVAFYTLKHLRAGRRSTGCHKNDPLHPASQLTGRCRVHSMEEPVSTNDSGEESLTLGDVLESRVDDPALEAGRRMDWAQLVHGRVSRKPTNLNQEVLDFAAGFGLRDPASFPGPGLSMGTAGGLREREKELAGWRGPFHLGVGWLALFTTAG